LDEYLPSDFLANFSIGDFFRFDETNNIGFDDPMLFEGASFVITDGNTTDPLWLLDGGTWVRSGDVAVVPVPGALLLFGSGLMGLLGVGHRQRRARHATPNIQKRKGDTQ
jgi:hypothetical protein